MTIELEWDDGYVNMMSASNSTDDCRSKLFARKDWWWMSAWMRHLATM